MANEEPNSRITSPTPSNNEPPPDKVIIDPSKGGAVSPKATKQSKALEVEPGCWIWDGLVNVLEVDLFSPAWEVRHGAAIALRELLKVQGKCGGMKGMIVIWKHTCIILSHSRQCLKGRQRDCT